MKAKSEYNIVGLEFFDVSWKALFGINLSENVPFHVRLNRSRINVLGKKKKAPIHNTEPLGGKEKAKTSAPLHVQVKINPIIISSTEKVKHEKMFFLADGVAHRPISTRN